MSKVLNSIVKAAVDECRNIIMNKDWPDLPFDMNSPVGDFSIICFSAAPVVKKKPEEIAKELVTDLKKLDCVQDASVKKGYCNVSLKWNEFAPELIKNSITSPPPYKTAPCRRDALFSCLNCTMGISSFISIPLDR